ncbi:MAG TPA: hypothetical protein VLJ60_10120 [bacterium]|nr:hypothetical protein [bacterium]
MVTTYNPETKKYEVADEKDKLIHLKDDMMELQIAVELQSFKRKIASACRNLKTVCNSKESKKEVDRVLKATIDLVSFFKKDIKIDIEEPKSALDVFFTEK